MSTPEIETYASEYEAHYRLITTREADLHRWMASCSGARCRWVDTKYSQSQASDAGLAHCKKKHVRKPS